LGQITPSPVVELNRAVAVGRDFGPEAGLEVLRPLIDLPSMRAYHLLPAVAGDLHCRAGDHEQARQHFLRAAELTSNAQERATMQGRASECVAHQLGDHPAAGAVGRDGR
jgi:RNA polymerase sigma-70 factor (ECF subfamily)